MAKTKGKKRSNPPKSPFNKERLITEMKLVGEFGLRNKKELYTFQKIRDDVKKQASSLLIETNETIFTVRARALLNKLKKQGVMVEKVDFFDRNSIASNLERVLDLDLPAFLSRRLQHRVFETGMAVSVHQARRFITFRYITVGNITVNKPNFIVNYAQNSAIQFSKTYEIMMKRKGGNNDISIQQQEGEVVVA
ncbi:40S ribosomal protein S9 [Cucumispora dikerogammari]|nr:40S ribosomal protein S9 [Cucumispora dikerogammari]